MVALDNWMSSNRVHLNASKAQFIWLGKWQELKNIDPPPPQATSAHFRCFVFSASVSNRCVVLHQELAFSEHLNLSCCTCFFQFQHLQTVSRSLPPNDALNRVHAFRCSFVDYCSAIYADLFGALCTARLIEGFSQFHHSRIMLPPLVSCFPPL